MHRIIHRDTTPKTTRYWLIAALLIRLLILELPAHAGAMTGPAEEPVQSTPTADGSKTGQSGIVPPAQPDRFNSEYVKDCFSDTGKILISPRHWDKNDWLKSGLVLGMASGLLLADTDIRTIAQKNRSAAGDSLASLGNVLGNPLYTLPPLGLFYLYGHLNEDPKARRTSLLAVESLAISGVFTWSLKVTTQRPRPYTGESAATWNGPGLQSLNPSFPSGHTQSAFSIASVVAEEYGSNPYVPPLAYGLATLTGLSRIYDNKHWASDVFVGGAIGYFVGKTVIRYHSAQSAPRVTILPAVTQQGFGLMANYRF